MKIKTTKVEDLGKFAEEINRNKLIKESRSNSNWFVFLFVTGFITTLFNTYLGLMLILSSIPCLIQAKYLSIIAYMKKEEKK